MARLLSPSRARRSRTLLLQAAGFDVARSATFADVPTCSGRASTRRRLTVGSRVFVNVDCLFDLSDRIVIGDNAYLAHRVMLLTSTHEIGRRWQRAGEMTTEPVTIGAGAWIGAGAIVLPGVTVGEGSIVGAGSVVTQDVEPSTMVAGTPAVPIRDLPA